MTEKQYERWREEALRATQFDDLEDTTIVEEEEEENEEEDDEEEDKEDEEKEKEEEYKVETAEDVDFSMANSGVVDAYLGSCNSGNTEVEWNACLDFFRINIDECNRQIANKAPESQHVRVPFKKLTGMSVGLFDYQLMGVYSLINLQLDGVSGGFLSDEQGLGKTQEMFGLIALAHNLRRCKTEVQEFWSPRSSSTGGTRRTASTVRHNPKKSAARSCQYDQKYGFRCYCYNELTRCIADLLPDGPNVVVAPARSCAPLIREAKTKLDTKTLKIRGHGKDVDKDYQLTPRDIALLQASIRAKQRPGQDEVEYHYQASSGHSDYVIFISPDSIDKLNSEFTILVKGKKKSAFLPGIIMLDEFHEYALSPESRTLAWLNHLKKCALNSQQPTPLAYFVSGTPMDQSPADLAPAISLLEKSAWSEPTHPLYPASSSQFQDLLTTFNSHIEAQSSGEVLAPETVTSYYTRFSTLLTRLMIRRLVTDSFLSRPLTTLTSPLKINIINHPIPSSLKPAIKTLQSTLLSLVPPESDSPLKFFRQPANRDLLLPLLLTSTFPSMASSHPSSSFTFSPSEISSFPLSPALSPYSPHIPSWTANSPKLTSIMATITSMLADASPLPQAASSLKKMLLLSPHEAESHILALWLSSLRIKGLKHAYVHPSLPQAERQKLIDGFLREGNGTANLLVMSLSTGGTGLNLQRASYCVVSSAGWTRREVEQGFARVWRVGQRAARVRLELLVSEGQGGSWAEGEVVMGGWGGGMMRGRKEEDGVEDAGEKGADARDGQEEEE
ncbi:hypothetical protein QBC43DRAFT_215299 [Cladorrhinum sp. PSN259]|nr:hypothetical protein QBC43DRAFT_215299 [Cladorrhinum sp. PSN259]